MKQKTKHRKLFYVQGMISLLVIPFVLYVLLKGLIIQPKESYISFNFPPKDYLEMYPEDNFKIGYNYKQIKIPSQFTDEIEEYYLNLILELQKKNIDKTGIKFQFSEDSTYENLVRLLNLMELTEQPRYLLDIEDDIFYVIHEMEIEHQREVPEFSY